MAHNRTSANTAEGEAFEAALWTYFIDGETCTEPEALHRAGESMLNRFNQLGAGDEPLAVTLAKLRHPYARPAPNDTR